MSKFQSVFAAFAFLLPGLVPTIACSDGGAEATDDAESDLKKDGGKNDSGTKKKADAGTAEKAQLADVSILFPLGKSASDLANGYLKASSSGPRGELLPEKVYDASGKIAGSFGGNAGGDGVADYSNLRVVALRIDPCFASLSPPKNGSGCSNQLRLVFQELTIAGATISAADSGLHAFYAISRSELVALTRALIALRVANSNGERLGALKPHSIVKSQGLAGPMGAGLRALISKYAGKSNLTRVTTLSVANTGFTWNFGGVDVIDANAGTVKAMKIPSLPGNATTQSFFRGFAVDPEGVATPTTNSSDNLMPLMNVNAANALSVSQRQATFGALLRVENPSNHSPDTIDCTSCHIATPATKLVAEPKFGLSATGNANAYVPDGKWVLPSEMKASFDDIGSLQVHAFSYNDTRPGINQRTVNESAAVVNYLNTNVLN